MIRNALLAGRSVSYRRALQILHLVNFCEKTTLWRSRKEGTDDAWLRTYKQYFPRYAQRAGLLVSKKRADDDNGPMTQSPKITTGQRSGG
jgi:hypothetical protein